MSKKPLSIFLLTLSSCFSGQIKNEVATSVSLPARPLVIESDNEGWGADMKLSIVSVATADAGTTYTVNAVYKNKNVGFAVIVPAEGSSKLTFKSSGEASDNFIRLLGKLYNQRPQAGYKCRDSVTVTGINLAEFAKKLGMKDKGEYNAAAQYKLFFEGEKEDDYAEMYLNINPKEQWIEWKEKDEEYRPALIKMLAKG